MDHFLSPPEIVRPWRTATLVAMAIAGVELVLLVVAGIVLLGRHIGPQLHKAASNAAAAQTAAATAPAKKVAPTPAKPHVAPPPKMAPRSRTRVLVLNGNGVQGAAAQAASLVKARGYAVGDVTNAPRGGYPRTLVMYRPTFRREAIRFRHDVNMGVVSPLDGMKPAQLHGADLVLILGSSR